MLDTPVFAERVIAWQKVHGRHDLPWQGTRDAYRIWISEIMLQQTQVAAVIAYYGRFVERFPDVATLALADSAEVMRLWSGLGYYSRARNLHRAAKVVVQDHGGVFPCSGAELAELPGIGRSTAAAIAAFAYGAREAILDGNVKRVFSRCFGIEGNPGAPAVTAALWRHAEALLPETQIEVYTQGLMDLGATLCTRSRPRCMDCPLAGTCVAHATGRTAELPQPKPRKSVPRRSCVMIVVLDRGRVLLERRPPSGIWGGLLSLPQADDEVAAQRRVEELGADWTSRSRLAAIQHGFTHYHLTIHPVVVRPANRATPVARDAGLPLSWMRIDEALAAGLPAPVKRLLGALAGDMFSARPADPGCRDVTSGLVVPDSGG